MESKRWPTMHTSSPTSLTQSAALDHSGLIPASDLRTSTSMWSHFATERHCTWSNWWTEYHGLILARFWLQKSKLGGEIEVFHFLIFIFFFFSQPIFSPQMKRIMDKLELRLEDIEDAESNRYMYLAFIFFENWQKLDRYTINIGDVHFFEPRKKGEMTPLLSNWIRHSRFSNWQVANIEIFNRIDFNGIVYHSRAASKSTRFCSYTALLADGMYCIINQFLCVTFEKRAQEIATLASDWKDEIRSEEKPKGKLNSNMVESPSNTEPCMLSMWETSFRKSF